MLAKERFANLPSYLEEYPGDQFKKLSQHEPASGGEELPSSKEGGGKLLCGR